MSLCSRLEMKYGLLLGLATMIWIGLEFFFARELQMPRFSDLTGNISFIFPLILIFFALKEKKASQGGKLEFFSAVKTGAIIGCITGVLSASFLGVYLYLNPEVLSGYIEYSAKTMQEAGQDQTAIDAAVQGFTALYSPPIQAFFMFAGSVCAAMIFSGIFGFVLRTQTPKIKL